MAFNTSDLESYISCLKPLLLPYLQPIKHLLTTVCSYTNPKACVISTNISNEF